MPSNYGYTKDGKHQPIDESAWDAAKKACANMKKADDGKCLWGMYKKNWESKHGSVLLGEKPKGGK